MLAMKHLTKMIYLLTACMETAVATSFTVAQAWICYTAQTIWRAQLTTTRIFYMVAKVLTHFTVEQAMTFYLLVTPKKAREILPKIR